MPDEILLQRKYEDFAKKIFGISVDIEQNRKSYIQESSQKNVQEKFVYTETIAGCEKNLACGYVPKKIPEL